MLHSALCVNACATLCEADMRKLLKLLNPLIFLVNLFKYTAHLEGQRALGQYVPYDFSGDTQYY